MTYSKFQDSLEEQLAKQVPEGCRISIHKVIKNNDLQLDSLVILSKQVNVSPNFYLQQYYEKYLHGMSMDEIISDILVKYEETRKKMGKYQIDLSLDTCRDKIVYRLSSGEKNRMRLENVPSIPFLDMVITFHVLMIEEEDGIGSVMVQNAFMEEWKMNTKELFQLAQENTMRIFPLQIHSMAQMLSGLMEDHPELMDEYPEEGLQGQGFQNTLVVSNQKGINGAAVLLYPGCLALLEEQCAGDYYILPSSIHEVLVLPDRDQIYGSGLQNMVREVNDNCVQADEILSDHVYHYSSKLKMVELCSKF